MTLSHVYKSYGGKAVLTDLTLTLPDDGLILLTGPSGIGKTTLLRLLMGLEKPDSGQVSDVGRVSVLFQEDRLFPHLTAADNVALVLSKERRFEAEQLLFRVGLEKDGDKYPSELSGGMCRRVAIARMLATEADTYLLDEPFKGLDPERKQAVRDLILEKTAGKRVVIVTHEPEDFDGVNTVSVELTRENC